MKIIWGLQGIGRRSEFPRGPQDAFIQVPSWSHSTPQAPLGRVWICEWIGGKKPTGLKNWETSYWYPWGSIGLWKDHGGESECFKPFIDRHALIFPTTLWDRTVISPFYSRENHCSLSLESVLLTVCYNGCKISIATGPFGSTEKLFDMLTCCVLICDLVGSSCVWKLTIWRGKRVWTL